MQVFDSTKDFKLCGAGLGISANGLKALRAISSEACQELEDSSRKPTDNKPTLMYDDEGKPRVKHSGSPAAAHPGRPPRLGREHDGVHVWAHLIVFVSSGPCTRAACAAASIVLPVGFPDAGFAHWPIHTF